MSGYFNKFPVITYETDLVKKTARNILTRGIVKETVEKNDSSFQTYQIQEGDRADNLATFLFSRPDMDYVFYLLNDIIDPYYEWYLTQEQLNISMYEKYGDELNDAHHYEGYNSVERGIVSLTTLQTLDEYTQLSTLDEKISYINYIKIEISNDTYDALSISDKANYTKVSNKQFQEKENEKRKYINVVEPSIGFEIDRDLKKVLL